MAAASRHELGDMGIQMFVNKKLVRFGSIEARRRSAMNTNATILQIPVVFKLANIIDAYDTFADAATSGALKVLIEA